MPKKIEAATAELDMTPMIDCVFQLIIFFMLVAEITKQDLEKVKLPVATMASKVEKGKPKDKLITINVAKKDKESTDGVIKIRGKALSSQDLEDTLKIEALNEEMVYDDVAKTQVSTIQILIRADREVQYKYVQEVFWKCMAQKIWKTMVATELAKKGGP